MGAQDTIDLCRESARQRGELNLHDLISYVQDYMNARVKYEQKLAEVNALCKILSAVKIEMDICKHELPWKHQVLVTIDHSYDKDDIETCRCEIVTTT